MPRRSLALALALALALYLLLPAPAAAQTASPTSEGVIVDLPCPAEATPTASRNGGPPLPARFVPAPASPVAVALALDTSAAMDGPGTPFSTRRADAALLATALLDRLPAGSRVSLVAFGGAARVALPLSDEPQAVRAALAALAAPDPLAPLSAAPRALADALALARGELAGAPEGPHVLVVFAAGGHAAEDPPDLAAHTAEPQLILVGLGPEAEALADEASYLPFHTDDISALPELLAAYERRAATLLNTSLSRIMISAPDLPTGAHRVTITGCGAPVTATFEVTARPPLAAVAGGAAAVLLLVAGAFWRRGWRRRDAGATARLGTARFGTSADVTTARGREAWAGAAPLAVSVWDGQEWRTHPMSGRQCTVGRDPGCDIVIESEWVSGLHARLSAVGDGVEITDLGSTNGTFIGAAGRPLAAGAAERLPFGEPVLIGPEVRLAVQPAAEAAP